MSERHDWLNLIEVSGPFLSIPVLDEAFPQGLEGHDKRDGARLRQAYDEWREAVDLNDPSLDELHRAWVDEILATALQMGEYDLRRGDQVGDVLHVSLPEHGVTLTTDIVLVNVNDTDKPLLPIFVQSPNAPLDEVVQRDGWAASPAERMVQYLRGVDCPIGLVTNGERWMLVHAPAGQVTSFVSWYARLWSQEPDTLRAFVSLLAVSRFYGPEEGQLPSLFAKSEKHQDEVTEALGDQVRTAIEVLIQAIDKANQDRNGELLDGVTPQELYEGGLTVMMRLVFILSAEERGLLLLGNTTYDNHYALSTFRQRLRRVSTNAHELLERRHAGWSRLLALFRAIYGGIEHSDLRLPAMGGSLFDPDRYPFLEGRGSSSNWLTDAADPLPIDDRTVLLMLDAIQSFEGRTLSYRALDVEQIGHVYEGLLERTVQQIDEVTLELRGSAQAKSPKATLRELAEIRLDGQEALIEVLKERTGRSVPALRRDLQRSRDSHLSAALLTACRGDVDLHDRVEPYVHLLALDPWGHPRLYHPGAYAVVLSSDRRETGTHYTPKSLTEKIVHETLTPVTYDGPAKGKPKEEWRLKSPVELLDLKVCDPAMGSGAFLVQACRWLGERLVEAWNLAEASGSVFGVDGEVLNSAEESELLPRDAEERTVIARRLVAERCLYGVDMNPLAVELAKLSIWLVTLAKGRPFEFLDHNLRCGNSLLGIHGIEQLAELYIPLSDRKGQMRIFGDTIKKAVEESVFKRRSIRDIYMRELADVENGGRLLNECLAVIEKPVRIADSLVNCYMENGSKRALKIAVDEIASYGERLLTGASDSCELGGFSCSQSGYNFFHWVLEFPEVFDSDRSGFDAVLGNPPYINAVSMYSGVGAEKVKRFLKVAYSSASGSYDIYVVFLELATKILRHGGRYGFVVPNKVMSAEYAESIRECLSKSNSVESIIDYSKIRVFSASVYPVVLVGMKGLSHKPVKVVDATKNSIKEVNRQAFESVPSLLWGSVLSEASNVVIKAMSAPSRLGSLFDVRGAATVSEAYEIKKLVVDTDGHELEPGFSKLIVSGNIKSFSNSWGTASVQYLKNGYNAPIVSLADLPPARKKQSTSPKVIVSGMSKQPVAFFDEYGEYLAGKSTVIILGDDERLGLKVIEAFINSKVVALIYRALYGGLALSGGYLRVGPPQISSLPFPLSAIDVLEDGRGIDYESAFCKAFGVSLSEVEELYGLIFG